MMKLISIVVYFDHDKKRLQYKMEMIHKEKKLSCLNN